MRKTGIETKTIRLDVKDLKRLDEMRARPNQPYWEMIKIMLDVYIDCLDDMKRNIPKDDVNLKGGKSQ